MRPYTVLTCILLQAGEGAAEASASADSILEEQKKVILLHPQLMYVNPYGVMSFGVPDTS
jgi:hypothetical protein